MSKDLGVAVIHGIGYQSPGYSHQMSEEIEERIRGLNADPSRIAWCEIHWADITEIPQQRYLGAARRRADLDYVTLRRFVVSALGDAAAYQRVGRTETSTYQRIHAVVNEAIGKLYHDLGQQDQPLIVMAHSLGGHIMSNYIWDLQKGNAPANGFSVFEKMGTLTGMITFGCNIPLFAMAHEKPTPIEFPPPTLPEPIRSKARWLNYYDPDDILGYPLRPLSREYAAAVSKDIPINVGGLLSSWNPKSHNEYWTDNSFTKPVARYFADVLKAI